jgi:hypothetical protein
MRIVRLNSSDNFQQILRESRENSRAPILNRASVNNGQTSFNGNESLIVTGSQKVTGWLIVTGTLKGVGTLLWEQVVNFTGAFTSTGPTKLNGPTEITDTLDVSAETLLRGATTIENTLDVAAETILRGALELLADLAVRAGGTITVDGIDPMVIGLTSAGRPGIQFSTGAQVVGTATGAQMNNAAGNGFVYANETVGMQRGSKYIRVGTAGVEVEGDITTDLPQISATGRTPNVWCDPATKKLYRLT